MGLKVLKGAISANILLLAFLYLIQGLPYGFQSRFMPIFLRSQGVSLTNVGLFKLLLIPWLCKTLWAPLVDRKGTKHSWLLASVLGLVLTCAVTSIIPPNNILLICLSMFMLNVCAATQDIAVDGIAVAILSAEELGHGNVAQVVGYKIGSIIGGGLLVWFLDVLGWMGLFLALTAVYLEALLFIKMFPKFKDLQKPGVLSDACAYQREKTTEPKISVQSNSFDTHDQSTMQSGFSQGDAFSDEMIDQCHSCNPEIKIKPADSNSGNESNNDLSLAITQRNFPQNKSASNMSQEKAAGLKCDCEKRLKARKERIEKRDKIRQRSAFVGTSGNETDVKLPINILSQLPSKFHFLEEVLTVPGTRWMMVYLLIYKLGEQGAIGMLPLFLLDRDVPRGDVTFWTGVVGQGVSIIGSVLGGYVLSNYRLPSHMVLQQLSVCRLMPLGGLLWLIAVWTLQGLGATTDMLFWGAMLAMCVLLLISGMITTVTFTLMMQCSQMAPANIQATHYTTLATFEVFGKLTFMSVVGWLVDNFGYGPMYLVFIILSIALLPWLNICPKVLVQKGNEN